MRLIKTEFARFFALGFAGGALLVFGAMGLGTGHSLSDSVASPAEAATTY
ncbi:hypothetical protein MTR62_08545 [Novosphingobium sp. 1949]|uniref:Uncharacterized protein n=1 Tax=Novosphingobium organovorum TaxID=2930092 RepID=A0ABT0BCL8_9SPHN|nr:hypothetical protein [Novosphingobium organovorum]MCJ2182738.1 hypothetical protein [Novosphingobium organovorum]